MGAEEFGISGGGRGAEAAFRSITGADPAPRASAGDALLGGHLIEIKNATSYTLNQVRAVKYITLVAYHVPADAWYVVPAHEVVRQVAAKARGQHTENPFESATLSLKNLGVFRISAPSHLKEATLTAANDSEAWMSLRYAMSQVLSESRALAAASVARVREVLVQGPPSTEV